MKLLLDTAVFLWYVSEPSKLSAKVLQGIQQADEVWLSVASFWEIAVKYKVGRLALSDTPNRFVPLQRERHDILSLRLDEEAIKRLTELPDIHADPFDRMLICQALSHSMQLVTSDRHIQAYPVPIFWD